MVVLRGASGGIPRSLRITSLSRAPLLQTSKAAQKYQESNKKETLPLFRRSVGPSDTIYWGGYEIDST